MHRTYKILALLLLMAMVLTACPAATPAPAEAPAAVEAPAAAEAPAAEAPAAEATTAPAPEAAPAADVITLEFWHAMGGNLGELVNELTARFNDSQDAIFVNATYTGSYDDTYNALLAAIETETLPNITQNFDIATQTMFDTGLLIPAWQLMAAEGFDADVFVPAVRNYYSDTDGMVGMAFNSSTPLIYYNAEMFEAAGVPPIEGSLSFSEFKALCDQLMAADVAPYCFTHGQVGWYFEQILANSGGLYFNNDNGRTDRATEVAFNSDLGVEVFTFLTSLIQEGYAPNLGSTWTETDSTFTTRQAAIMIDSTSDVSIITKSEFPVGTAFIPHADSAERNGVAIGGGALWLVDSGDDAVNDAAWQFMKFMSEDAQQITWHKGSGYFPVRMALQDNAELQAYWAENPNFGTAIRQLFTTKSTLDDGSINYAVLGGRAGPFPAIRRIVVETYSRVLDDGLTPKEALDEAAVKANAELESYNSFFQ